MTPVAKIIWTAVILTLAGLLDKILTPASELASGYAIVGQMQSSDEAALAAHYVGNGSWIPSAIIFPIVVLILYFLWKPKK